ncbi:MAG: hypothetical protein WC621_01250 [Patescibacteria group bacterium]
MLISAVWFTSATLWPLFSISAQTDFNYNYILSDNDILDYQTMTPAEIQNFLLSKNSPLANYYDSITNWRADKIIYQSSQDWQINPKFLLALMQKEQSLIDNSTPVQTNFDWATGYAVCDDCSYDDLLIQKFKGFYNQVYNAAKKIRLGYLPDLDKNGKTSSGFGPGLAKQVDNITVVPANRATAILYTYTPHLKGNRLMSLVWNKYFMRSYPDGTVVNVEGESAVWLIESGWRRRFANKSVYLSRYNSWDKVITVSQTELLKYPEGKIIKFPNYSYLRNERGTVYLLTNDMLRGFSSSSALRQIGINPAEIVNVTTVDLIDYAESQPITTKSVYPLGTLAQDTKTGGVYWVQDGVKHPIFSVEILKANFGKRRINKFNAKQLAEYTTSTPVLFPDGELVTSRSDSAVYLISNKQRRPFVSAKAFLELGFDFKNVIVTAESAMGVHELGQIIGETY